MKIRFVFLGLVILFIVLTVNSCKEDDRITLNKTSLFLENGDPQAGTTNGDTVTLIAVNPYSNKKVIWKSSNPNIVTVTSDGLVTAISKGRATIIASVQNKKQTATCSVTVADYREKWVGDWDFIITEYAVNGGLPRWDTIYYSGKIIIANAFNLLSIYYSENPFIAAVIKSGTIFHDYNYNSLSGVSASPCGYIWNDSISLRFRSGSHLSLWTQDIAGVKKK